MYVELFQQRLQREVVLSCTLFFVPTKAKFTDYNDYDYDYDYMYMDFKNCDHDLQLCTITIDYN